MEVNKRQLELALEIVKPGLASKEIIEQATSFAFVEGRVVTYNDAISISHPVPGLQIEGAIPAENLYKLLSKIKVSKEEENEKNLNIEIKDNELILSKGKMKAGFTLQTEIKLPIKEEIITVSKWYDLPEGFTEALDLSLASCGRDMSNPVLCNVHIAEEGFIEGSDSFQLTRGTLGSDMPVKSFLIPASSAVDVVRLEPTKIAEGKGWIHFENADETIISCRVVEDKYPPTEHLLNITGHKIILPDVILDVLGRAGIIAKRDHEIEETIKVEIGDKKLRITTEADNSWYAEEININFKEHLIFSVTPYLLKSILKKTRECLVGNDRLKFEGQGWVHIAALKD